MSDHLQILVGDCRETLAELEPNSAQCCVTSPPYYGLRDYGHDGQIGLEQTPDEYVAEMVQVFDQVKRVLSDDGVLFLNLGDSYCGCSVGSFNGGGFKDISAVNGTRNMSGVKTSGNLDKVKACASSGIKPKDLIGIPWRVAFALQQDGWYLRQDIIWHKPNPMPESVTDRCTKAHEYVFLLSKSARYYWDQEQIREPIKMQEGDTVRAPKLGSHRADGNYKLVTEKAYETIKGANKRSVWSIGSEPYSGAHFATMPPKLAETCILAGSKAGDTVLDPFGGSGTTGMVAIENGRKAILCELNDEYVELIKDRTSVTVGFGF